MSYIGNTPGVSSQRLVTSYIATAGQTSFVATGGYVRGYLDVYLNGVKLSYVDDFTATDGVNVVLSVGASAGDTVELVAYIPRGLSDGYTKAEADARFMSADKETLPDQTSNSGKFLKTDGTQASWETVDKSTVGLGNVEDKSSSTIRSEITSSNVTTALGYTPVNKAGDTMTGSLTSNKAEILTTSGSRFNLTKTSVGNQHIIATSQGVSNTACKIHGFTFATPSTETQAGIVFSENGEDGTGIGMYTTGSYASGPQLGLTLEPGGAVLKPRHPAFYVQHDASNGTNQTNTTVILTSVQFDRTSSYNTSNGRYTAPVAGCYQFFFGTIKSDNGRSPDGYVSRFRMRKNGTNFSTELRLSENGGYGDSASMVALVNLARGDYVDVYISDSGGWYGNTYAHFGGHLIG